MSDPSTPKAGQFQSTHPRGVRPWPMFPSRMRSRVSIHAPTRGATSPPTGNHPSSTSFNPRTHAGCDRCRSPRQGFAASFNPRTHAGCDGIPGSRNPFEKVSIHAPTRGATVMGHNARRHAVFQSTHPRGVRRGSRPPPRARPACFNPRTHAGCDGHVHNINSIRCQTPSLRERNPQSHPLKAPALLRVAFPHDMNELTAARTSRIRHESLGFARRRGTQPTHPTSPS